MDPKKSETIVSVWNSKASKKAQESTSAEKSASAGLSTADAVNANGM